MCKNLEGKEHETSRELKDYSLNSNHLHVEEEQMLRGVRRAGSTCREGVVNSSQTLKS